ncbi:glycine--tRNA ligase [Candidatus Jorgensenbacteria bacterium CG10_big_fil_rev_8_21_14_0_10_54_38]|uniref:Glycine--tRNA ligase n=2 Tax=Candidatus Joergenseniibacteriota TaxID=1752739 RepID=A0A2M6WFX1_9BACT|nr:MAG: glycine--tRNA ligase [Candidatus Jorgensenbacteria bacterium CG23_combo_of_CG06-09_8_20_14_all_54_14]PIT91679.1 MAG: glycine--tRNA ligase [Candidatus Jorgensenbacteria bacterium CG10_big_fil_rev_8_21_14_0_10_54_38]
MDTFEKVVSLAKRRGFIYPGSDIYGGLAGFYDWGHLGVKLKWNIEWAWWRDTVQLRDDVVGIDAAVIMNPKAWEASGHVSGFADELVECKKCHGRFRSNEIGISKFEFLISNETICPTCGAKGNFTEPKQFNLMFKTHVGPAEDSSSVAYLRPETAGGIFVNFKNVLDTNRVKIPFGIAQIGKVFRNEINPRDFVFRTREFKQMELEYFVKPGEDGKYFDEWVERRFKWYESIGLKHIRKREQKKEERAHYSKATTDIEYKFPMSAEGGSPPKADAPLEHASGGDWQEIEGVANRGDFDLTQHAKFSGRDLTYFDETTKERYLPYVIEPSAGVERIALALLCDAYHEEEDRIVLKFHPKIAPMKAAVFPLLANKPQLVELARKIYEELKQEWNVAWDDRGNIGKRYYAQDEIGTPFCITVDFDSLEKNDVTVRDRDTTRQERVKIAELKKYLSERLEEETS